MTTVVIDTALDPPPEQLSVYVVSFAIGPTDALPLTARVPVQPPDAVQLVAPVDDQLSVVVPFRGTDFGLAFSVSDTPDDVCTVTAAVRVTVPPAPVQASV